MATYSVTLINEAKNLKMVVPVEDDDYILDAVAKHFGENLDDDETRTSAFGCQWSCLAGACSTCTAKLVSGEVDQSDQSFLDDDQVAAGYVLLCVAYPQSDCTLIVDREEDLYQEDA